MEDPIPTNNKTCSCRQKSDCPLNQNCSSEFLVYNPVVNTSTTKNYYRTCEKSFKERYNHHTSSEINHVRKVQSLLTAHGNWKKMVRITQTIGWLLWKHIHTFVEQENMIYVCVKNYLLLELIQHVYYLWRCGVVVITTAQLHSKKPELRFCAGSNHAHGMSEIRDGEDL